MVDDPYLELIAPRASAGAFQWLKNALARCAEEERDSQDAPSRIWMGAYAGASRRFGGEPLALLDSERTALGEDGVELPEPLALDELVRAVLLRSALRTCAPERHTSVLRGVYQRGDSRERRALLRSLALLPEPERFANIAAEACRSHVQHVFEAIACENPYPARCLGEPAFNQLVLKALFTDVPLKRVSGLEARVSPELVRMARDYRDERRAAGRPVSSDLDWLSEATPAENTS